MDSAQRSCLTEVDWLATSPIGTYAAAFKRHLTKRRYAAHTIASYLAEITHFARWACTRHVPLARIDEVSVAIFLDDHLPGCACTGHVRHDRADHSAALGHLLLVLRAQGAIAHPPVSTVPVDEELRRYDEHMDHARGLAPRTRSSALRIVGRLLSERFDDAVIDIAAIKPEHVRRFFAEQAAQYREPAGAGCVVSSLRGLLPLPRLAGRSGPRLDRRAVLPGSPHTLRHTSAMHLLQSGVRFNVIALWLGHESTTTTHRYVEADLAMKQKALARLQPPDTKMGRYKPPDALMRFLQTL